MEITKSISFKVNLGDFQNVDFFCSAKLEAKEGEEEKVAQELYDFCAKQLEKDYRSSLKHWATIINKETKERLLNEEID